MTLDFKGRFLFTASYKPSKISMFTMDPNSGALQEVPNPPFASSFTSDPVFLYLAAEMR
jgi:6-phosphogluconolactonase (cycloisomerase 2 family)